MEELLKLAQDLVANLRNEIANVKQKADNLATALSETEGIKASQQVYAAELAGREVECRKVEDVLNLKAKVKAMANDLEVDREKLRGEIEKFELVKKQYANTKQEQAHAQELIDKGNELLKKGNAELKEAKANMRSQILDELKAKV